MDLLGQLALLVGITVIVAMALVSAAVLAEVLRDQLRSARRRPDLTAPRRNSPPPIREEDL